MRFETGPFTHAQEENQYSTNIRGDVTDTQQSMDQVF